MPHLYQFGVKWQKALNVSRYIVIMTYHATSLSIATEELLTKLKQFEMPKFQRPRQRPPMVSDDVNTSADLMKTADLDSSEPDNTIGKEITNITLSSSN